MSKKIYRVSEGAQLSGVCAGLEASGKGNATLWRLIFFLGTWFWLVGLVVYIYFACSWPKAKSIKDAQRMAGITSKEVDGITALDDIESRIARLAGMREKGIINDDEYEKLRKKELDID